MPTTSEVAVKPLPFQAEGIRDCKTCKFRSSRIFCNFGPQTLERFNSVGVEHTCPAGAYLFYEGLPATGAMVLCTGQVKLSCLSRDGRTFILKIAGPGDVLGLSATLLGTPYEVTAETLETCQMKILQKDELLRFLEQNTEAGLHAAKAVSEDYKNAFLDARRLTLSGSAAGKLARILLDWGASATCGKREMRFTMTLTHEDLASMAGISRETVTRLLSRFKQEKLIEIHGSSMLIRLPEKLEDVCK